MCSSDLDPKASYRKLLASQLLKKGALMIAMFFGMGGMGFNHTSYNQMMAAGCGSSAMEEISEGSTL